MLYERVIQGVTGTVITLYTGRHLAFPRFKIAKFSYVHHSQGGTPAYTGYVALVHNHWFSDRSSNYVTNYGITPMAGLAKQAITPTNLRLQWVVAAPDRPVVSL